MEKRVTLQTVQEAVDTLESQGERVSQRKIRSFLGGGSPNEINRFLKQIEAADSAGIGLPSELPPTLMKSLLTEITKLVMTSTEALRAEVAKGQSRESEALEDLTQSEQRVETLEKELKETIDRANRDRQEAEKSTALSSREIADLKTRIGALEAERQQLIEAGEMARTEAAKALVRAEATDQSMAKAETRVRELEGQLAKLQEGKSNGERARAVAEQRSAGLEESLSETRLALAELKADSKEMIAEQKREIQDLRNHKTQLEKALALAEKEIENLKHHSGLKEKSCD